MVSSDLIKVEQFFKINNNYYLFVLVHIVPVLGPAEKMCHILFN